jgi:hypothetical protein
MLFILLRYELRKCHKIMSYLDFLLIYHKFYMIIPAKMCNDPFNMYLCFRYCVHSLVMAVPVSREISSYLNKRLSYLLKLIRCVSRIENLTTKMSVPKCLVTL